MNADPNITIGDVRAVVAGIDTTGAAATIGDDDSLLAAAVIDSLAMVELIGALESRFAIRLDDRDLTPENFETLRAIRDLVQRRSQSAGREAE